ncbi:tyrosine-type recombinase/integrase [Pandoraea apista]|uniref:tyrosine-type recombinase/integrase n=1 Tax=Pandoraea apista TaxID=93218 RepID=UPI00065E7140|nr:site-specific integrase [Pandoraea apista]ALS63587.1 integrase [Pandoraea apista]
MASFRKRGDTWRAEIVRSGVRLSESFKTKAEAVAWAAKKEAEIMHGQHRHYTKSGKTLADAFDQYLLEVSPTKAKHGWNVTRIAFLKNQLSFVGELIHKVKAEHIKSWTDDRLSEVKTSTVNRDLNLLSAVFEAAHTDWKWIPSNPVHEVRRPKNPKSRDRLISLEERNAILKHLGYDDDAPVETAQQYIAVAFQLAIETAMRRGEILGLVWGRVHVSKRFLHLDKTKNGDARDVPLSKRACELIEKLPKVKGENRCFPVNPGTADTLWRRAVAKAGIEGLTFHDSRHQAITSLSKKLDILALSRMVGTRDPRTLMVYYNETASAIASRLD